MYTKTIILAVALLCLFGALDARVAKHAKAKDVSKNSLIKTDFLFGKFFHDRQFF